MPSAGTVLDHVLEDARKRLDISDYYLDRVSRDRAQEILERRSSR